MLKPYFARVLLKRQKLTQVGSIIVPEEAQTRHASLRAVVTAVGPTCDPSIKVGATVLLGKYAGEWLDSDGNPTPKGDHYICQDEDILAEVISSDGGSNSAG